MVTRLERRWHSKLTTLLPEPYASADFRLISGGMSNYNFCATLDNERFFVRCQSELSGALGIDRAQEKSCQMMAAGYGLAPQIIWSSPDMQCMISEWIDGETLVEAKGEAEPQQLARLVARLHQLPLPETRLNLPERTKWYWEHIPNCLKTPERRQLHQKLMDYACHLEPVAMRFCHHDLNPHNILLARQKLSLVDWEYAAAGDPAFDLATIRFSHQMTAKRWQQFYHAYSQESESIPMQRINRMQPLLEWSSWLWALVMSQGESVFNSLGFAEEMEYVLRFRITNGEFK